MKNMAKQTGRFLKEEGGYLNIANFLHERNATVSDQAGRQRISQPISLGDYKLVFNRLPQFFDTVTSGTADVTYNSERKSHKFETTADNDYAIVQTYQRHNYFAGKSQFIEFTSFAFHDQPNVEKQYGYYSSSIVAPHQANLDGFYLYTDGTGHYLRIVNNGTEILNVPQSEWDDPLDGTGASGFTIDWEKFNVFRFSFLWLGGTGLRFSIISGARIIQVYDYAHVGSVNSDKLIFSRPSKPIRMEIIQSGAGSGLFEPVCSTVITESSESSSNIGEALSFNSGSANNIKLSYPERGIVKGIRLKPDCLCAIVDILGIETFANSNNDFYKWEIVLNPSLVDGDGVAKTLTFTDVTDRQVQQTTGDGATFAVGGTVIESGYGSARALVSAPVESARKLGASITGVTDELYLVISPLQGTTNIQVFGGINIKSFV